MLQTLSGMHQKSYKSAKQPNTLQAYSCSIDGTLCLWDVVTGQLLRHHLLGEPLFALVISRQLSIAYASTVTSNGEGRVSTEAG
jgi:hypothetical protein